MERKEEPNECNDGRRSAFTELAFAVANLQ